MSTMTTTNAGIFSADARWQNTQHRKLVELARDPHLARITVELFDDHPSIKKHSSGIYSLAKQTLESI